MNAKVLTLPSLTIAHPAEALVLRALSGVVVLLIVAYVYGIAASTFHIIARKQAETENTVVRSALAQLNAEYYTLTQGITETRAHDLGLTELALKSYATREVHVGYASTRVQ